jgi:hypothetical protein
MIERYGQRDISDWGTGSARTAEDVPERSPEPRSLAKLPWVNI